jgi:tRNA threonylcarbamoyladenosine biosynthesis protein TsaB
MVVLALDTSSAGGSAAVLRTHGNDAIVVERAGDAARSHGVRLPLELMAVLREAGVALDEVEHLAVAVGPGSYTGLRVGIATIQGLALGRGIPVTPVSIFDALGWHARDSADAIAPWVDAHRGEVFATLLARDGRTVLAGASSLSPEATIDAWRDRLASHGRVRFLGDGAVRYREVIAARLGGQATMDETVPLLAGAVGRIAAAEPDRAVRPHALAPLYIRRTDAELARDRRQGAGKANP